MKPELKKLLVLNLPYLLFVYLFAKCGQAYRLAAGADASAKLLHLTDGISAAFASPLPSLHPFDLCVGVVGAVAVRLIVYSKGKNAKKYRKGEEYGSARWGTAKDIAPYIDPKFENNILENCRHGEMADPYRWTATTVGYILDRQEYLGHTVLGKSICENFKTKQRRAATADELMIFPNTHEAIVDQDTWNIAHKLRLRKRPKAANGT